ncbi:MAG: hypothetical protein VX438_16480 [Planctomycetota bacterium]|nr:hypothetical protein [Planctomycetota bacterium]
MTVGSTGTLRMAFQATVGFVICILYRLGVRVKRVECFGVSSPKSNAVKMQIRSFALLRIVLLVLFPFALIVYIYGVVFNIFAGLVFDPARTEAEVLKGILLNGLFFGGIGLFVYVWVPKGMIPVANGLNRPDDEYFWPLWVRRMSLVLSMIWIPAFFLFHLLGPLFWFWVPFLNHQPWIPANCTIYYVSLTAILTSPFWVNLLPASKKRMKKEHVKLDSIVDQP